MPSCPICEDAGRFAVGSAFYVCTCGAGAPLPRAVLDELEEPDGVRGSADELAELREPTPIPCVTVTARTFAELTRKANAYDQVRASTINLVAVLAELVDDAAAARARWHG